MPARLLKVTGTPSRAADARRRFGLAWIVLCLALALHVLDEAANDFLAVYNPAAAAINDWIGVPVLPVFDFSQWLAGLIASIVILLALSPFAFRGSRWITVLAVVFAVVMIGNGILHTLVSIHSLAPMPGVYSSPILIAAGIWLLSATRQVLPARRQPES